MNNFSDVNSELAEELSEEIEKGNIEEAKAIAAFTAFTVWAELSSGMRAAVAEIFRSGAVNGEISFPYGVLRFDSPSGA